MDDVDYGLTPSQRRAVLAALFHTEKVIGLVDELLTGPPARIFSRATFDVSTDHRAQLARDLMEVRTLLLQIVNRFDIEPYERDGRRVARTELAEVWANLEEIRLRRLSRYGAVDPALDGTLGPPVDALIHLVVLMIRMMDEELLG